MLGIRHRLEVLVEEGAEDRLFVGEVVVDVPLRQPRILGDVAHARRAVAAVREELEGRRQDLFATSFRPFFLVHGFSFVFSTLPYGVRGSASRNTNRFGTLYFAMRTARY